MIKSNDNKPFVSWLSLGILGFLMFGVLLYVELDKSKQDKRQSVEYALNFNHVVEAEPNLAIIKAAVSAENADVIAASTNVESRFSDLYKALLSLGLSEEDIKAGNVQSHQRHRAQNERVHWVSRPITISLDLSGSLEVANIIAVLHEYAVNAIHGIEYKADPKAVTAQLIESARNQAFKHAEVAAGGKSVELRSLTLNLNGSHAVRPMMRMEAMAVADKAAMPTYTTERETVSAHVQAVFSSK